MSCEIECADKAKGDTSQAYENHANGTITLEQLKEELERIWNAYINCLNDCLAQP